MNNIGLSCSSIWSVPLDYENNKLKIVESIKKCKKLNCGIRIGGELELCGVNRFIYLKFRNFPMYHIIGFLYI